MATELVIRRGELGDAWELANLSGMLGYPVDALTLERRLVRLLAREEDVILVAAGPRNGVVGWLHGAEQELLESGRRCEILGLVVHAGHRGHGVGRRLVAAVEQWAAGRGLEEVTVRSNVVRPEAHPFYERLGYRRIKTQHAYRKPLRAPSNTVAG
jgi:GNAT superfamily N-acetyltransferase